MMTTVEAVSLKPALKSPYRGIESFRYVDAPIFAARDEEVQRLLRLITVYRAVLLYGDSGTGKSSLINAGLIPVVIKDGFRPDRLRIQPRANEEIIIERISMTDGGHAPFLPSNFIGIDDGPSRVVLSIDAFKARLRGIPQSQHPLLIFDQFEEFVTLFEEAPRGEAIAEALQAQQAILQALIELIRDPSLPVKLLLVFREDYLAKLHKLVILYPDLQDQYLRLTQLRTDSLPVIIRGPFERCPEQFERALPAELMLRLEDEFRERSEDGLLNLSEVQIACLRLWESKAPSALFREKRVQGLLEDFLSRSLDELGEELRLPAVALFSNMVTESGARNIVSEDDLISRVHQQEGIPKTQLEQALHALEQDTKLVTRESRHGVVFYEIVSEFLIPWINQQRALRAEQIAQIEGRKKTRAYIFARVCVLIAVLLGGLATWVYQQLREETKTARTEAEKRQISDARASALQAYIEQQKAEQDKERAIEESIKLRADKAKADADAALSRLQLDDANKLLTDYKQSLSTVQDWLKNKLSDNLNDSSWLIKRYDDLGNGDRFTVPGEYLKQPDQGNSNITVQYLSDSDSQNIAELSQQLSALGFKVSSKKPETEVSAPLNAIVVGSKRTADTDVKKIALCLIRSGFELKVFLRDERLGNAVQIKGLQEIKEGYQCNKDYSPCSVEQINKLPF